MYKPDLISFVATHAKLSNKEAAAAVDAVFNGIGAGLKANKEATFRGFGRFVINTWSPRKMTNPKTGVEIDVPTRDFIRFKPGKELKLASK